MRFVINFGIYPPQYNTFKFSINCTSIRLVSCEAAGFKYLELSVDDGVTFFNFEQNRTYHLNGDEFLPAVRWSQSSGYLTNNCVRGFVAVTYGEGKEEREYLAKKHLTGQLPGNCAVLLPTDIIANGTFQSDLLYAPRYSEDISLKIQFTPTVVGDATLTIFRTHGLGGTQSRIICVWRCAPGITVEADMPPINYGFFGQDGMNYYERDPLSQYFIRLTLSSGAAGRINCGFLAIE